MRTILFYGLSVFLCVNLHAQENLVPNGGFEDLTNCPHLGPGGGDIWLASPWDNICAQGTADIFNVCAQLQISTTDTFYIYSVPENDRGYQFAHSGDGYVGFYAVSDPETYPNAREFIQTPLTKPLHPGIRYEVRFYVSLAEKFQYAVGMLGVYFSLNPLDQVACEILPVVEPQIQSPVGVIYSDKENWMEIRDTLYIPRSEEGGQQWMTIGNFLPDSLSQITFVDSGAGYGYDRSYYYIDDVSVIALDSVPNGIEGKEKDKWNFSVYPNPATDVVRFRVLDPSAALRVTVRVLDAVGRPSIHHPLVADGTQGDTSIDLSGLPIGMYFLELRDEEGRRAVRRFVKE